MLKKFLDKITNPYPGQTLNVYKYKYFLLITAGLFISVLLGFVSSLIDTDNIFPGIVKIILNFLWCIIALVSLLTLMKVKVFMVLIDIAIIVSLFVYTDILRSIRDFININDDYFFFIIPVTVLAWHIIVIIFWSVYILIKKSTDEKIKEGFSEIKTALNTKQGNIEKQVNELESLLDEKKKELEKKQQKLDKDLEELKKNSSNPYPDYDDKDTVLDFFVTPPVGLGHITHAYSTLKKNQEPLTSTRKTINFVLALCLGGYSAQSRPPIPQ